MVRPNCHETDFVQYLSSWTIVSFSIFTATDAMVEKDIGVTQAVLAVPLLVLRNFVHMFALSVLLLSIVEAYVAYARTEHYLCTRRVYLELNTLMAGVFLVLLTLLNCFQSLIQGGTGLDPTTIFVCRLVPWIIVSTVLGAEIVDVTRSAKTQCAVTRRDTSAQK